MRMYKTVNNANIMEPAKSKCDLIPILKLMDEYTSYGYTDDIHITTKRINGWYPLATFSFTRNVIPYRPSAFPISVFRSPLYDDRKEVTKIVLPHCTFTDIYHYLHGFERSKKRTCMYARIIHTDNSVSVMTKLGYQAPNIILKDIGSN
jgi:hypothetical protein